MSRPRQAKYEATAKGKATKARYVWSHKGRRRRLLYDLTTRYSRCADNFIARQEAKFGTASTN